MKGSSCHGGGGSGGSNSNSKAASSTTASQCYSRVTRSSALLHAARPGRAHALTYRFCARYCLAQSQHHNIILILYSINFVGRDFFFLHSRCVLFAPTCRPPRGGTENHVYLIFRFSCFSLSSFAHQVQQSYERYLSLARDPTYRRLEKSGVKPFAIRSSATVRPIANTTIFRISARWTETTVIAGVNII